MSEDIFPRHEVTFQTENVTAFPSEGGADRDPENIGKTRVHLELLFDNIDDAISWMKSQRIPTEAIRP